MKRTERRRLVEEVASAFRPVDLLTGELLPSGAFLDLDEEGRDEAFKTGVLMRRIEASLDPEGLSTTCRAVLARLTRTDE
ncbi:MAG: hypothetical protein KC561_01100 [Myxococcales bacterium]|nr:hypothetical protein [Myxococcales bacterium]